MRSLGGTGYERVSFAISDAIAHASQRLAAKPEEKVLDVATGTGWAARNVASDGTRVTGVDISSGLLDAAKAASAHMAPRIDLRVACAVFR